MAKEIISTPWLTFFFVYISNYFCFKYFYVRILFLSNFYEWKIYCLLYTKHPVFFAK